MNTYYQYVEEEGTDGRERRWALRVKLVGRVASCYCVYIYISFNTLLIVFPVSATKPRVLCVACSILRGLFHYLH